MKRLGKSRNYKAIWKRIKELTEKTRTANTRFHFIIFMVVFTPA